MNKRSRKLLLLVLAGGVAAAGCGVRTSAEVKTLALPRTYSPLNDATLSPGTADLSEWWTEFKDPLLDSLVQRAVAGNLDLKIARERVHEARATRGYTAATRQLPNTGISGGYSDNGRGARNFTTQSGSGGGLFQTGFDASYELDIFGGGRASVRAAEADLQGTGEGVRDTLVTVVAETARNYLALREAQARLEVARGSLKAQQETFRLTELRRRAGLTSDFDTTRAQAQLETTRAGIPALEAEAQRSINAIALLIGAQPAELQSELSAGGEIPQSPPEVPLGLPSDLLRRRPDIRRAERNIAGSAARVGVAVSNLYPKFSLTSNAGGQSNILTQVLAGAARIWSFGGSFSWGLLNYPATKANIKAAESREQQSIAEYEKTVLTALTDVENALAAYVKERERQPALEQAVQANRKALELAKIRYDKGLSSLLEVLDAQRSLYSAEDAVTRNRAAVGTHLVALYKSVGGGW